VRSRRWQGGAVRIGIITLVTLLVPRAHNAWELDATPDDLDAVIRAADRLGYDHLTASEHVAVPVDVGAHRGHRYYDLLSTLSYAAAVTERIRLCANVVVLPYHHPVEILKRYGTLDLLSRGRLVLGVGVGSLAEEFELLGRPFEGRGESADESLQLIRACWGRREPSWDGPRFPVANMVVDPTGVQGHVPIWVGGRTRRSLRRAVELGDGWMPFQVSPEDVAAMLEWARSLPSWGERSAPPEVVLRPRAADPGDPAGAERVLAEIDRYRAAGATVLQVAFTSRSVAHHLEQMEALTGILELTPP